MPKVFGKRRLLQGAKYYLTTKTTHSYFGEYIKEIPAHPLQPFHNLWLITSVAIDGSSHKRKLLIKGEN